MKKKKNSCRCHTPSFLQWRRCDHHLHRVCRPGGPKPWATGQGQQRGTKAETKDFCENDKHCCCGSEEVESKQLWGQIDH